MMAVTAGFSLMISEPQGMIWHILTAGLLIFPMLNVQPGKGMWKKPVYTKIFSHCDANRWKVWALIYVI